MDKRKEANLKVKKLITDALLALMEKKDINEISVTELITTAGVARVSFYRNYSSKENVLIVLINFILNDFRGGKEYDEIDYRTIEHIEQCFNYIYKYRNYILGLYR
ncbi:MAG: TetR/AcrR family transcriptional regulator, partial [Clostridia bacterium]|nr:TetR/AcrR family transcriptional regulator [Clostridia bacterium]